MLSSNTKSTQERSFQEMQKTELNETKSTAAEQNIIFSLYSITVTDWIHRSIIELSTSAHHYYRIFNRAKYIQDGTWNSSLRGNSESLGPEAVPGGPGDDLAGAEVELTGAVGERRAIVVDMANEAAAGVADDPGPLPLDAPVVEGLEEGLDLVLLLEPKLGGVDGGEGQGALVAGLEVEPSWEEVVGAQVQVRSALLAAVDSGSHCFVCSEETLHVRGNGGRRHTIPAKNFPKARF